MAYTKINVIHAEGSREKLEILEVDEVKCILGVFLEVDENNETQIKEIRKVTSYGMKR